MVFFLNIYLPKKTEMLALSQDNVPEQSVISIHEDCGFGKLEQ